MIYIFSGIFLYLFFALFLYLFQRKILFNTSDKPNHPIDYGLSFVKEVNILTSDNISLLSWFFYSKSKSPLLIYFHGNSFNIGERAYRIQKYINKNWSVLLVSWRGYSGNLGKPSEKNLYKDAEATLTWVKNNTTFKSSDLVIYGESLGAGVAVELGTKYQFLSVVLEAPFTSIPDIAQKRYKIFPSKLLVKDKFDNLKKIKNIKSPLLIISGKKDEVIPHEHSKILYNEAKVIKKSVFIDEAMHNNLYDFDIANEVINFNLKLWK